MDPSLPAGPSSAPAVMMYRWFRWPLETLEAVSARHGDAFTLRMPGKSFVVFSHPQAVKAIFTGDSDELHAGEANVVLKAVLGEGSILVMDGARHLRERKLMMPPFHGERMRSYGLAMRDATLRRMARWPLGKPFPIHAEVQAITLEVILRAVFGMDEGDGLDEMRDAIARWAELGTSRLGTALLLLIPPERTKGFLELANTKITAFGRQLPIGRIAPWAPLVDAGTRLSELLHAQIARRRRQGTEGREDILSMLLDARDEDGRPMTDEQLRDEMLTLLVAGHETTATSLAWVTQLLCAHPQAMRALTAELTAAFPDGTLQPEKAIGLERLDGSIKESLRLRPVVPLVGRVLKKPMHIGGYDLPAGVAVLASLYLTHRRPDLWPDPLRYDPMRFAAGKKIDPYHYYPFGGGIRRCLGMAFASYEMKIVLGTILLGKRLTGVPGDDVSVAPPIRRGITFAPKGGMRVIAA